MRQSKTERIYEARIADLKTEHARMVKLMADEIEYLRSQVIGPQRAAQIRSDGSSDEWDFMPSARENPHFVSEEEEDLRALRENGHIEEVEYRAAMAALGRVVGPIQVDGLNDPHAAEFFNDED